MWPYALLAVSIFQTLPDPAVSVRVDSSRHEVTVAAGPFAVGGGTGHHEHGGRAAILLPFRWPVGGWLRGVAIEIADGQGRPLSRRLLHHLNIINLERRQLVQPAYERLLAVGQETGDLSLPAGVGVPVADQSRLALLVAWDHLAPEDLGAVDLKVRFRWLPLNTSPAPVDVLPLPLDVGFEPGESDAYDLPPGLSERRLEFTVTGTGRILAMGGHLHDHGLSIRLEDPASGKVLVDLRPEVGPDGRLIKMPIRVPGASGDGILLRAGHTYRVVARYHNPTGETLVDGAMALMIGIFAPDRPDRRMWAVEGVPELKIDARALAALHVIGELPAEWRADH
jgi:hypothetical protein